MEELNPTNAFGEILLDLIEAQFSGDYDAGITALTETTGLEEADVVDIVQGNTIVDNPDLLASIADAFQDADEEDLQALINTAVDVEAADREELISGIEETEAMAEGDTGMEDEEVPEGEEAMNYGYRANTANFSGLAEENQYLNNRLNQLEDRLATFGYANAVQGELARLDNVAKQYVDAELLPPSYKAMLVGNFSNDEERLAKFSAIAEKNNVDIPTMLFATNYALSMLTDASRFVEFKDYSTSEQDAAVANFNASLDSVVERDIQAIFNG